MQAASYLLSLCMEDLILMPLTCPSAPGLPGVELPVPETDRRLPSITDTRCGERALKCTQVCSGHSLLLVGPTHGQ